MKTNLPEAITTIAQAKAFLRELHSNGELYHPEDSAHDMMSWHGMPDDEPRPTTEQCDQLDKLMQDIYDLPGNKDKYPDLLFDPCKYGLQINSVALLREYYKDEGAMSIIGSTLHINPHAEVTIQSIANICEFDFNKDNDCDQFVAKYGQMTLAQFIAAVEPAFGMKEENVSGEDAYDKPTPLFTARIQAIGNEAGRWLLASVKEKIVLFDVDGENEEELLDMPDFEAFDKHGSSGYANVISIGPDPNKPQYLLITGISKDDGSTEEAYAHELSAWEVANLADHIIASRAAALED